jgi:hypothetical protein
MDAKTQLIVALVGLLTTVAPLVGVLVAYAIAVIKKKTSEVEQAKDRRVDGAAFNAVQASKEARAAEGITGAEAKERAVAAVLATVRGVTKERAELAVQSAVAQAEGVGATGAAERKQVAPETP